MSEPRTAAGRALLDVIEAATGWAAAEIDRDFGPLVADVEQEAAAIDVERVARAFRAGGARLHENTWHVYEYDLPTIAREYEKLRTPEGEG